MRVSVRFCNSVVVSICLVEGFLVFSILYTDSLPFVDPVVLYCAPRAHVMCRRFVAVVLHITLLRAAILHRLLAARGGSCAAACLHV